MLFETRIQKSFRTPRPLRKAAAVRRAVESTFEPLESRRLYSVSATDTLTGGAGTDQASGQAGDDLLIWAPGDGSDLNDGGDGIDTVEIDGGSVSESFSADPTADGTRVLFQRTSPAPFTVNIGS